MKEKEKKEHLRKLAAEMLPDHTLTFNLKVKKKSPERSIKIERLKELIKVLRKELNAFPEQSTRKSKESDQLKCLTYAMARRTNREFTLEQIGAAIDKHHSTIIYHVDVVEDLLSINAEVRGTEYTMAEFIDKITTIIKRELYEKDNINI
jgi:hypothetical protein